jgi:hypothetical protein
VRSGKTATLARGSVRPNGGCKLAILVSIPGIAETAALSMLIEMPELGTLGGKQAASLAGLAR